MNVEMPVTSLRLPGRLPGNVVEWAGRCYGRRPVSGERRWRVQPIDVQLSIELHAILEELMNLHCSNVESGREEMNTVPSEWS